MLTHEEWVNGVGMSLAWRAAAHHNPARDTNRPNGWKSQPWGDWYQA
jgi:hypothetical protein